jgi:hypothetical protein
MKVLKEHFAGTIVVMGICLLLLYLFYNNGKPFGDILGREFITIAIFGFLCIISQVAFLLVLILQLVKKHKVVRNIIGIILVFFVFGSTFLMLFDYLHSSWVFYATH